MRSRSSVLRFAAATSVALGTFAVSLAASADEPAPAAPPAPSTTAPSEPPAVAAPPPQAPAEAAPVPAPIPALPAAPPAPPQPLDVVKPARVSPATIAMLDAEARDEDRHAYGKAFAGLGVGATLLGMGTYFFVRDRGESDQIVGATLLPISVVSFAAAGNALLESRHAYLAAVARSATPQQLERVWEAQASSARSRRIVLAVGFLVASGVALGVGTYDAFDKRSGRDGLAAAADIGAGATGAYVGVSLLTSRSPVETSWAVYRAMQTAPRAQARPVQVGAAPLAGGGAAVSLGGAF